jgi:hypothetical protein
MTKIPRGKRDMARKAKKTKKKIKAKKAPKRTKRKAKRAPAKKAKVVKPKVKPEAEGDVVEINTVSYAMGYLIP